MEKVRPLCGQPSDRGRLKNRTDCFSVVIYVDIVILALSWRGFRGLLDVLGLHVQTSLFGLSCNINENSMYEFYSKKRNCMYGTIFPPSRLGVSDLQFVLQFKYLGVGTHYNTQPV